MYSGITANCVAGSFPFQLTGLCASTPRRERLSAAERPSLLPDFLSLASRIIAFLIYPDILGTLHGFVNLSLADFLLTCDNFTLPGEGYRLLIPVAIVQSAGSWREAYKNAAPRRDRNAKASCRGAAFFIILSLPPSGRSCTRRRIHRSRSTPRRRPRGTCCPGYRGRN